MTEGIKRRDFLKVVGAGGAGATMFGCSTERVENLMPYVVGPEEITPGVATWYSSVCGDCAAGCGIRVRTREGRAVKLEGNPDHPVSRGGLCSRGHSSLQALYNPDRVTGPLVREGDGFRSISWEEAEALLATRLQEATGDRLLITGAAGGSMAQLAADFVAAVGGSHVVYEALSEAPLREATRLVFGVDAVPAFDLSGARQIFSFGADFLEGWVSPVEHGRAFSRMAVADELGSKGKLVFLGARLPLTGLNADEWVPLQPGTEAAVALGMANVISGGGRAAGPWSEVVAAHTPEIAGQISGVSADDIRRLAEEFATRGPSLALGPGFSGQHRGATAANVGVMILNAVAASGAPGLTENMGFAIGADIEAPTAPYADMEAAIRAMAGGGVAVAMVRGTNPAYSLPPGAGFRDAFGAVAFRVSFASAMDETASLSDLILPDSHFLESWGDSNPRSGAYGIQQPVMQRVPHFDSKPTADVLLSVAAQTGNDLGSATFYDYIRNRWQGMHAAAASGDFGAFWDEALRVGFAAIGTPTDMPTTLRAPDSALSFDAPAFDGPDREFYLMVVPSGRFWDGRGANRSWLQELPDTISKIAWHSWVEINPHKAEEMGLRDGDLVRVASPHGEVEVPVFLYPGIREDTVALQMGGGHDSYGRYADGNGVNAMTLLPAESEQPSGGMVTLATRVNLEPTGQRRPLATIDGSGGDQHRRAITPAVALAELGRGEEEHHEELQEIQLLGGFAPVTTTGESDAFPLPGARYGEYDPETQPRWAMAIDLDKCTGCSACVTACQAENNVPSVGEDQVIMGRDMHWVRIERYYETVDASHAGPVDVRFLPMICQHCGNAGCEPVCPVFAAYHTPDGLNGQIYNRCVGTRYCANNCPYKVRVFNWFSYSDVPEPLNWQYNPDVTVREGGVMEKCSFCVQRIRDAGNRAALEDREVRDGDVVTACEQSCPAEAIVFGNIRDPESRVAQLVRNERTYRVLDELINTQPAVNYLKKVTFHEVESIEH